MEPPCYLMVKRFYPEARSYAVNRLASEGMSQRDIADGLGITPAMVQKYLGRVPGEQPGWIVDLGNAMAGAVLSVTDPSDRISMICSSCKRVRSDGGFCDSHDIDGCDLCTDGGEISNGAERRLVLENLKAAYRSISNTDLSALVPQVRINIAYGIHDPEAITDIAAFPGRLSSPHGPLVALAEPEFGASHHLSVLLLDIMSGPGGARAIANIAFTDTTLEAARSFDWTVAKLEEGKGTSEHSISEDDPDILLAEGGFGIEPALYVLGCDAIDVVSRLLMINERTIEMLEA